MSQVTFGSVVKKSGTYAVSFAINRGLSFLLIPLYTRYLTTTDYGILELLDLTMNFVITFAGSRLGQALFYYYFSEKDERVREKHISTSIVGSFGLGAVLFAFAFLTAGLLSRLVFGTPQYTAYFQLVAVSMALTIPQETYLCAVRAFNEPRFYTIVSVARTVIASTVNVILLTGWNMGVRSMLWSAIVSQACLFVALTWFVFRRVPLSFSWGLLRKQAEYAIPLSFSSVGEFILNYGDRYFLRQSVSLGEIGLYSLAYKIAMMLPTVQWPFALYWSSQQVQLVSGEGGERLFARVCTYLALGLTFVAVLITLFVHPLLHVMVSPGCGCRRRNTRSLADAGVPDARGGRAFPRSFRDQETPVCRCARELGWHHCVPDRLWRDSDSQAGRLGRRSTRRRKLRGAGSLRILHRAKFVASPL